MSLVRLLSKKYLLDENGFSIRPSGINAKAHYHSFVEIVYFYKGSGTHEIDGKTFNIHSGDIFLINPMVTHRYNTYSENSQPIEVYNIMFTKEFVGVDVKLNNFIGSYYKATFNRDYENEAPKYLAVHGDIKHNVFSLYNLIQDEYSTRKSGDTSYYIIKYLLNALLSKLFKVHEISNRANLLPVNTSDLINEALDYVNAHCQEPLTLSDVAKKYNYSPQYFNKLLQRQTGTSFNQYLQKRRMLLAGDLLRSTDYSLDEICGRVGYLDLKHFYYIFKKHIGVSPAKYRAFVKKQDRSDD